MLFTACPLFLLPTRMLSFMRPGSLFILLTNVFQVPRAMYGKYQAFHKYLVNKWVNVDFKFNGIPMVYTFRMYFISIGSSWLIMFFKSFMSLCIFCLFDISFWDRYVKICNSECRYTISMLFCQLLVYKFWTYIFSICSPLFYIFFVDCSFLTSKKYLPSYNLMIFLEITFWWKLMLPYQFFPGYLHAIFPICFYLLQCHFEDHI